MRKLLLILPLLFLLVSCDSLFKPKIVLETGDDIVNVFEEHIDAGCYLKVGSNKYDMTVISNNVDTDVIGEYKIEYEYEYKEKLYSYERIVKVVDEEAPTISLNPGNDTIKVGETHLDAGIEASDNYSETVEIVINSDLDITKVGTYTIQYVVTDEAGNISSLTRVVNVVE
jgi:hypothetical protein